MHTARQLDKSLFSIVHAGQPATREDLLPGWTSLDRLGVVITEPLGALGASHLIQLAITAFYDARPGRRAGRLDSEDPKAIYPEIYLFHVGGAHGDHSAFDFWPARKEVVVEADARRVLDAINDRAVTRLAVPDRDPVPVAHEHKEPAAARDRISTALAYSPTARARDPHWVISGLDPRTEANVRRVLDPNSRYISAAARTLSPDDKLLRARSWPVRTESRRDEALHGLSVALERREKARDVRGLARETYRTIEVDEALEMLV